MKKCLLCTAFLLTLAAASPARAEVATFTRDLTVSGRVDLTVATASGNIHLTSGPAGRVQIFGRVKSNWGGSDAQVHEIADHPPIEQTGNIVRIGTGHESFRDIGIDYDIQVPADAFLSAATGSGNLPTTAWAPMQNSARAQAPFTPQACRADSRSPQAPAAFMPSKLATAM